MKLKSGIASLGALAGIALTAAAFFLLGVNWIFILIVLGLGIASYIVAAVGAGTARDISGFGEFMRGWCIGLNAAANGTLGYGLVSLFAGVAGGAVVGAVLFVINILAVIGPLTQTGFYQGVLGYFNWLMPMSWLIVALGLVFFLFSYLLHAVTAGKVDYLQVKDIGGDAKTGTVFIKGGLVANLNYADTAFNMGNFSFVDKNSSSWHKEHEAGHTLNLAAFGCVFHLIGALEENATGRGANAFAERIAESNASGSGSNNIPMWA